jgi:beta-lactamase class A
LTAALLLAALLAGPACAGDRTQHADPVLTRELRALTTDFHGTVGIYTRQLRTGHWAALNQYEMFPTASLVKIPILLALFERIDKGSVTYNAPLAYDHSREASDGDITAAFKDSATITTAKLVTLMETFSDNTAAMWCQDLAGGGGTINTWLEDHGFIQTRVNSRTPGREEQKKQFGWGQTNPREMAELMVKIREGKAVSPAASQEMFKVLSRTFWDQESISQIPPYVHVASKQGAVDHSRSEVLLVNSPKGDYVLSVFTKDQADASWKHENEGYELLRKISAVVWKRWGGKPWKPAPGSQIYWKQD